MKCACYEVSMNDFDVIYIISSSSKVEMKQITSFVYI